MLTYFKKFKTFIVLWLATSSAIVYSDPSQEPLFLVAPVKPIMMFNMSKDHQLFFKLYDDYSDITNAAGGDPDGIADTTYNNNFEYYGYFDSDKCYSYDTTNNRFVPVISMQADGYCQTAVAVTRYWSGNFLNWASMTRVDAIRKILYGGLRSSDTTSLTVLERAFLPNDAHSFAKYYGGADLPQLTPFDSNIAAADLRQRGITLCNTTEPNVRNTYSQNATTASGARPLIRVARGNYSLWASNERWQCRWDTGSATQGRNGNDPLLTGIYSYAVSPGEAAAGSSQYVARVEVCASSFSAESTSKEQCKTYTTATTTTRKPTGLLQEYSNRVHFSLMTGSYRNNKSGGVLRKLAGPIDSKDSASHAGDEIMDDGRFKVPGNGQSIIRSLDLLKIYGYNFNDGTYNDGDNCDWAISFFNDELSGGGAGTGRCSNWGNPQAEIFLESLRYLAGKSASSFAVNDSTYIADLNHVATWSDPITVSATGTNKCAPLNVLQFNSSTTSYDNDNLGVAADISFTDTGIRTATSNIGVLEGINSIADVVSGSIPTFFVGENSINNNQLCDAKQINTTTGGLGVVEGICSEAPRLEGGYNIAGLAYLARKNGIGADREKVKTHGIVLSPAIPSISIPVPGSTDKTVTILPACRNATPNPDANCAIVDFKVISGPTLVNGANVGSLYVNWEDSEQGGDYDQDMWGTINYSVSASQVVVTTQVMAQSSGDSMGFGYVISGTTRDGFHVHSGIGDFIYPSAHAGFVGCTNTAAGRCDCRDDNNHAACTVNYVTGVVNTVGTTVNRVSGTNFSGLMAGTPITINGVVYKIQSVTNNNSLVLTSSAGTQNNRNYSVSARSQTFDIGASTARKLENPLYYAAKWGGYTKDALSDADILATNPNNKTYFYATNPIKLKESMEELFKAISGVIGSSTTVAANSTSLQGDTHVYQARFDSEDWSGQVLDFGLTAAGVSDTPSWDTHVTMERTTTFLSTRRVYTYDGATTRAVVQLDDANWTDAASKLPSLRNALKLPSPTESDYSVAKLRYDWLRGYSDKENVLFRKRTHLLGDIINSDPGYAGTGSQRHQNLPASATSFGASSYASYVTHATDPKSKNNRKSAVFVGANDGMLHAFDSANGKELFAYIPRGVYSKLISLSNINYTHQYTVDGPVYVSDYFRTSDSTWRTIVAGTLGAGGKGAYALDVTDVLAGTAFAPTVIFDISADDSTQPLKDDLGYSMSRVLVLPANADTVSGGGRWVALFSNGTNSTNGRAKLIAIDVNDPTKYRSIDTQAEFSTTNKENGLSPAAFLPGSQNVISAVYAGDMMGNMWKFDLSNEDMSLWNVAYFNGSIPAPLIKAVDSTGKAQPISAEPTLGLNSLKTVSGSPSIMVYFVTGKYADTTDNTTTDIQSIYAIADTKVRIDMDKDNRTSLLHEKTIDAEIGGKRVIKNDKSTTALVDWSTKNGWFMDLVIKTGTSPFTLGTPMGERGLSKPLLIFDRLIVNTFIPSNKQCDLGGSGWLMELVGVGDKFLAHSVLNINQDADGDGVLDGLEDADGDGVSDNLEDTDNDGVSDNCDLNPTDNTVTDSKCSLVSGVQLSRPIISDLIALEAGENVLILGSNLGQKKDEDPDINETISVFEGDTAGGSRGRMSWRQIK